MGVTGVLSRIPRAGRVWLALPVQAAAAGIVFCILGFVMTLVGSLYDGVISLIGYILAPVILSVTTVGIVVVVGLPLRIIRRLRDWWTSHGGWFLGAGLAGFLTLVLSYFLGDAGPIQIPPSGGDPGGTVYGPDWRLFLPGWFVLAFSIVHFWWPRTWRASARRTAPGGSAPARDAECVSL